MERHTFLSPKVWNEGLLEGVADNLCFGPGTLFFPAIWPGGVWGIETVSVSRGWCAGNSRGWDCRVGPGLLILSDCGQVPLLRQLCPTSPQMWVAWGRGLHTRIPRPPKEKVMPKASHLSILNGHKAGRDRA